MVDNYLVYDTVIEQTNSTWDSWVTEAEDHQDISDRFEENLKSVLMKLSGRGTYRTATAAAKEALRATFPALIPPFGVILPTPIIPFFKNLSSREKGEQVDEFWVVVSKHLTQQSRGQFIWGFLSNYGDTNRICSVRGSLFVSEDGRVNEVSIAQNTILRALKDRMDSRRRQGNPEYSLSDRAWQGEPEDFWTDLATMIAEREDMKSVLYAIPLSGEDMDAVPSGGIINWLW